MSAICIRRPVMTILVMASFIIAGIFGYKQLPVAAVPRVDFPTIQVTGAAAGRQPRDDGGVGRLDPRAPVLDHRRRDDDDLDRLARQHLDRPAVRPQPEHRRRGARRAVGDLLGDAPPAAPSCRRRPASARSIRPTTPILFLALKSSQVRLSDVDAFANRAILPRISTLPGIAQVLIFGTPEICRARARQPRPARGARPDPAGAAERHRRGQLDQAARRDRRPAPERDPRRHRPDQQGGRLHAGDRGLAERRAGAHLRRRHRDRQRRERQGRELARRHARHPARRLPPARRQHRRGGRSGQGDAAGDPGRAAEPASTSPC